MKTNYTLYTSKNNGAVVFFKMRNSIKLVDSLKSIRSISIQAVDLNEYPEQRDYTQNNSDINVTRTLQFVDLNEYKDEDKDENRLFQPEKTPSIQFVNLQDFEKNIVPFASKKINDSFTRILI